MSIQSSDKKDKIFNDINITPLTDIFLVLLIIMMVVAPMFQTVDKNLKMPEINSGTNIENEETTVSITKNGEFFLDSERTTAEKIELQLKEKIGSLKNKLVVVKADEGTKNKEIMKVMRAAQAAGFEKLTVSGEPLSKKQQDKLITNSEYDKTSE